MKSQRRPAAACEATESRRGEHDCLQALLPSGPYALERPNVRPDRAQDPAVDEAAALVAFDRRPLELRRRDETMLVRELGTKVFEECLHAGARYERPETVREIACWQGIGRLAPNSLPTVVSGWGEESQAEFAEMVGVDRRGRVCQRVGAGLRLRERDHLADVLLAHQDRDEAVDAEREPGVRRRAEAERIEQKPEPRLRLVGFDARSA